MDRAKMDFEIDRAALDSALRNLGIDPDTVPDLSPVQPPAQAPPFQPLSDWEWACVERHISHAVRLMRPREAARSFFEHLLICEHAGLSTRFLPDGQEATRQRALRWALNGRLEKLATDLRAADELNEDRLLAFDALGEKAKQMRERILGTRAVRLDKRTIA
jgi:hypothetical protein